ncbi:hypothetical protein [Lewinella sp. IMCC34191]|uniref:hypothetical protein n=1 Tax=Lewinella sp. IMCC34191 TaxID=2259172 RepID=UPI000E2754B3|nr:hypothetical protein [Lewinella sp. IMCC34191]
MKVKEWLAEGKYRSDADRVLQHILDAPENLDDLMKLVLQEGGGAQVTRASMVVGHLGRIKPGWLLPYLDDMLEVLTGPRHPAVRRNLLRYLSELPPEVIPGRLHGKAADRALKITDTAEEPVASRVFAMQIVANLCELYPDLAGELRDCLEFHLPRASPGFRSRSRKILAQLPK